MSNIRNLVVGGVSLVKCKARQFGPAAMKARNILEPELERNLYLSAARFRTVSLILRFGTRDKPIPDIGDIDVNRSMLPVAIELDAKHLETLNSQELEDHFKVVMIEVLCDVAANFDLPYEFLDNLRGK
ncbi:Imm39 family immunity protein [Massilia rubra]|uniref:Uncharacterized protein n=1 Tax=Massilia rubra TaxID=2607910 RepID=A0ABX0LV85_9BURK|nr:Imm39 family immunity protein [Massilia rubra]NHZ36240.1 hypothetical protein [Massilia rubra]